jgi:hypothetical protein
VSIRLREIMRTARISSTSEKAGMSWVMRSIAASGKPSGALVAQEQA